MQSFILLIIGVIGVYGKVTPDYFPQCKRSDPDIDKCVLNAIEDLRPRLKAGIPEVNIPALEPFAMPTLKLNRTASNLRLKAILKHMKAYGGGNFRIDKLKLNLNNKYAAEARVFIPSLKVSGDYDVRGSRILTLDINGKGKLRGNFTGITAVAKGLAKPIDKNGTEYLQAEKIIMKIRIGNAQIALDDSDSPGAASSAAAFFNASPDIVLEILTPIIEDTGAAILKSFINKVLSGIPLHEVLVD